MRGDREEKRGEMERGLRVCRGERGGEWGEVRGDREEKRGEMERGCGSVEGRGEESGER